MRWVAATLLALSLVLGLGLGLAQGRFGFMPPGGIQLLQSVLEQCDGCGGVGELSGMDRSAEDWRSYFHERGALADLTEAEASTLARYLATAFPTEEASDSFEALPRDGRTIVIQQCQICHSIATPMLEDREPDAWFQHRSRPPHNSFELSDAEWRHIASYLGLNAPIAEDSIPAEMRQGAGGY